MSAEVETTPTLISEAELAEHLSEVLDRVASGELIEIERDGEVIVSLTPKRPLKPIWTWGDFVEFLQTQTAFDEEFAENVRRHRDEQPEAKAPEWPE